jgi:hypothetical protein
MRSPVAMRRRNRSCVCASWWSASSSTIDSPGRRHILSLALVPAEKNKYANLELRVAGDALSGCRGSRCLHHALVAGSSLLSCSSSPRPHALHLTIRITKTLMKAIR